MSKPRKSAEWKKVEQYDDLRVEDEFQWCREYMGFHDSHKGYGPMKADVGGTPR